MIFGRRWNHLYNAVKYLDLGSLLTLVLGGVFNKKSKLFWQMGIDLIPTEYKNLCFTSIFEKSKGFASTIFNNASPATRDALNLEHRARLIREILVYCRDHTTAVVPCNCKYP